MEQKTMTKMRNRYIDIETGILLCYMIFGHITQWGNMQDVPACLILEKMFFFFMPFFFFKGGEFFTDKKTNVIAVSGFKRLMIPYIVFSLIGHCLWCVHLTLTDDFSLRTVLLFPLLEVLKYGAVKGNLALWFLLSLFCVRVLFSVIVKKVNSIVVFIVFAIISTILNVLDLTIPDYCENIPAGLMFFSAGFVMKERQYHKKVILACILIYLSMFLFGWSLVDMRGNCLARGCYVHWIFTSIAGIILFTNILKRTENLAAFRLLSYLGKNSIHYYVTHWMVLTLVMIVYRDILNLNIDSTYFEVLLVSCTTLLPCAVCILKQPKLYWVWGK